MLQGLVEGLIGVSMSLTMLSSRLDFFFSKPAISMFYVLFYEQDQLVFLCIRKISKKSTSFQFVFFDKTKLSTTIDQKKSLN